MDIIHNSIFFLELIYRLSYSLHIKCNNPCNHRFYKNLHTIHTYYLQHNILKDMFPHTIKPNYHLFDINIFHSNRLNIITFHYNLHKILCIIYGINRFLFVGTTYSLRYMYHKSNS